MKKTLLIFILLISITSLYSKEKYPFQDSKLSISERIEDLINRMTLDEKIDLLAGYNDFYLHPCERLGIPAFRMADGPLGIASWGLWGRATAFPSALLVSASWNKKLASELGNVYAQEWKARDIHFMLAPGVNMYRASKDARNFEYYGEDPYLTSEMVVPFIKSIQDNGIVATIKHFVGNDQEFDRYTVSTEVSERALHEIYLAPFKEAVKRAKVKAVMTGYNLLNGVYCTENKTIIDILKKDWGFKGMLMSDWACTYSAENAANNGLDLEMGSKRCFNRPVLHALIDAGKVSEETINEKVRRIYGTCMEMGFFDNKQDTQKYNIYNNEANKMAYKAATEGIILLKNNGILPIKKDVKSIAVIGPNANPVFISDRKFNNMSIVYGGGGSSKVNPWHYTSVLDGINQVFPDANILYNEGVSNNLKKEIFENSIFYTNNGRRGLELKMYNVSEDNNPATDNDLLKDQEKAAGRTSNSNNANTESANTSTDKDYISRIDDKISFEWWGKPFNNNKISNNYYAEWSGYVIAHKKDKMRFFVDAQGGYKLSLNGKVVIDAIKSVSFDCRNTCIEVNPNEKITVRLEYANHNCNPAEIRMGYMYDSDLRFDEAEKIAKKADVIVFCAGLDGTLELEGRDRPFSLPYGQDILINKLYDINPNVVVVAQCGGGFDMSQWIDKTPAVVHAIYAGQEGGKAIADILSGKVNPSGKLPFTIEKRWEDSPAYGNYDETRDKKKIYYNEGIFMGYRGYDHNNVKPLFAFGHGLSYTTFDYSDCKVTVKNKKDAEVGVSMTIKNTGSVKGAETVQIYVHDVKSKLPRPLKELKGFEKIMLNPQESKQIEIDLKKNAFQYYDDSKHNWVLEHGKFEIWIGTASDNIKYKQTINL